LTSLVLELQNDARCSSSPILDLLRNALVVATKLNLLDFQKWINQELDGYDRINEAPDYRFVQGIIETIGPYSGVGYHKGIVTHDVLIAQPLSELIALTKSSISSSSSRVHLPFFSLEWNNQTEGSVSIASIEQIENAVRNIILKQSLKLESLGILGEGMTFSLEEKEAAVKYIITNFQTFLGAVGAVQNGNDNIAKVEQTFNLNNAEILQAIADLRDQVSTLSADRQSVANGAIADLETAVSNPSLLERAKSALWILWGVGQGVVSFLDPLTAIAERFGVHFHN
jgi:AbiTii